MNQRHPSLPMTYGNYELSNSIEALALISAPGISIYNGPLLCHNSPLLRYNSPSATDVSELIYVDRMITTKNWQTN